MQGYGGDGILRDLGTDTDYKVSGGTGAWGEGSSVKGKALKGWWSCGVAEASLVAGPSSEWTSQGTDIGKGAVGPWHRGPLRLSLLVDKQAD